MQSSSMVLLSAATDRPRSVLFITVDDMRPSIGAFNFSLAHTPNLDKLASEGLTFKRAYVNYAFCAPSRNSFMSGRRPDTTRVWNFQNHFREDGVGASWRSLPEYFKSHGMITMGSGKLYHPTVPPDNDWPKSWSTDPGLRAYYSPECMPPKCPHSVAPFNHTQLDGEPSGEFHCTSEDPPGLPRERANQRATACPANTTADESRWEYQLEDQRIRDSCAAQLEAAAAQGKGFFLGCGFHKACYAMLCYAILRRRSLVRAFSICIPRPRSPLLAAAARAVGVPARVPRPLPFGPRRHPSGERHVRARRHA
jgi:arylsulfatase A-like enzyme